MKNIFFASLFLCFLSCKNNQVSKEQLVSMLRSDDIDSILSAIERIQNKRDTSMLIYLLDNADDPRIIHKLKYKGMSVYQVRMTTIRFLTGIESNEAITYKPDSAIIKFYLSLLDKAPHSQ
ncbi:MAG: hypothetical protein ACK4E0_17765 [Chitinophagaceae bacterium]